MRFAWKTHVFSTIIRVYKGLRYLEIQEELIKYLKKDCNFLIRAKL